MQPTPLSQPSMYDSPMFRFLRMPSSVIEPGTLVFSRSLAVTWTSSRRLNSWFGVGMYLLKTSEAIAANVGCATQVPSWPARTSRSLSARTFSMAASLALGSSLMGIWAAMPPCVHHVNFRPQNMQRG